MKLAEISITTRDTSKQDAFIKRMYEKYPYRNPFMRGDVHVMVWGEGDDQELGMFELKPSTAAKDAVEVDWFQAYPLRKGVGTKAMKELQDEAKKDGLKLTLFPWDKGQISQAKLVKFYKSLGFKMINRGGKEMVWEPPEDLKKELEESVNRLQEAETKRVKPLTYMNMIKRIFNVRSTDNHQHGNVLTTINDCDIEATFYNPNDMWENNFERIEVWKNHKKIAELINPNATLNEIRDFLKRSTTT